MCNFVPGECIGIARTGVVGELLSDWALPGRLKTLPLPFEDAGISDPFNDYELIHICGIPEGLELLTVSKLSAMLAKEIGNHRAVAELNYLLPLSTLPSYAPTPGFTPPAELLVKRLKRFAEDAVTVAGMLPGMPPGMLPKMALLDSGINPSQLRTTRSLTSYDYVGGRAERLGPSSGGSPADLTDHDKVGHGTSVLRILEAILPESVPIVSGRVAGGGSDVVTVLNVTRAFAHLVAAESPTVVNLSLAPRDDTVYCPHCRRSIPVPSFHSTLLPFVFHLGAHTTIPVVAAGNSGRPADPRLLQPTAQPPLFAVATGSSGTRTNYSNYVVEDRVWSLSAFGGDPAEQAEGYGIFAADRQTIGTSFAAPFVSGAAVIASLGRRGLQPWRDDEGFYNACRYLLGTWTPAARQVSPSDLFNAQMSPSEIIQTEDSVIIGDVTLPVRRY